MEEHRKLCTPALLLILIGLCVYITFQLSHWFDNKRIIYNIREPTLAVNITASDTSKGEDVVPRITHNNTERKLIYVHGRLDVQKGDRIFYKEHCPVKTCDITTDIKVGKEADLVLWGDITRVPGTPPFPRKSRDQIWAMQILEAPGHAPNLKNYKGMVNWTITYRSDSTFTLPYFRFKYYTEPELRPPDLPKFATGKTKKVAWLVSNMSSKFRIRYFEQLAKHIQAERVGKPKYDCPRRKMLECLDRIGRDYKFYFAAENSFCKEYMTEKVGRNAYKYNLIPILFGARKEDYIRRLPPDSFILAEDFKSPKLLADYLHKIDQNDTLYNQFFKYKKLLYVDAEFTHPWCEICSRLHMRGLKPSWYDDLNQWWGKDACRSPPWQILK